MHVEYNMATKTQMAWVGA